MFMSQEFPRPAGRPTGAPATSEAAWALTGLWAGVATVMGLAAATIEPISDLGRGAVVFAAVGVACAVALASAAMMFGIAAALAGWRRFKPLLSHAVPVSALPVPPPPGGNPILEELVAGLAAQFARFDKKFEAATGGGAAPGRDGGDAGPDQMRESVAHAAQRFMLEQGALEARTKAEAESAELRSKARLNALAEAVLPRVNTLNDDVARLRRALAEGEARLRQFEQQVFDILRARDAGDALRRLDAEASALFDKLFDADERHYDAAAAWQADYALWKSRINTFWDILRGYSTDVEQPFAVTNADVGRAGGIPDTALFATQDMRFCYQMMVVVNERHMNFRENAFSFNAEKAKPPQPGAAPAQQVPSPPTKTRQPAASGSLVA